LTKKPPLHASGRKPWDRRPARGLDRATQARVRKTWGSLLRLAEARVRLERSRPALLVRVADAAPAVWSEIENDRVSFASEIEMQLGTCCRQWGTLIFKGKFKSNTSITGGIIFVTSIDEEESPYKYRSHIGTFTATLVN